MLKLTGEDEQAFRDLARMIRNAEVALRRFGFQWLVGAGEVVARILAESGKNPVYGPSQAPFWTPWRVPQGYRFDCVALTCSNMTAGECVRRQITTDAQRTKQADRGQGTKYPACDTRKCAQGRALREALDPATPVTRNGAGPEGWFEPERRQVDRKAQRAAKREQRRVGLLDEERVLDVHPDPVEE